MIARRVLRDKYINADIGISGANFAIAETGMISLTENEGNARLTCALPKTHITLMGIEKVLPKLEDLALFLPMLGTAGAGQLMTGYNTTYGTTYQGPIGAVITPHLRGLQEWKHLVFCSSLCGACTEACPVKIDLHHHLLQSRRDAIAQKPVWWEKLAFKGLAVLFNNAWIFSLGMKLGRVGQIFHPLIKSTRFDPAIAWTQSRELPKVAPETFREWWSNRK